MGGLGNQMFQYAAGRRLAWHHKTQLRIDLGFLKGRQEGVIPRTYELIHFNINALIAKAGEVAEITCLGDNILHTIFIRAKQIIGLAKLSPNVFMERYFHFDPGLMNASDNIYLEGYWQSPKYFEEIEDIIREEFTVRYPQSGRNKELSAAIASCDSVSLHVRRGDFLSNPQTCEAHGVLGTRYYDLCIDYVADRVAAPHFFVFSDEPEWAKDNLKIPFDATFISHNGQDKGYEDLRLMSQCKHHIIANSSFSWWGAWLSLNPIKIVCAPKEWFSGFVGDTRDLMPDSWVRI